MVKKKIPASVFCLLSSLLILLPAIATASFQYNENCQRAMLDILDLKTNTARQILQKEKEANPGNGFVIYLEHYSDCIELIATEDPGIYSRIINSYQERMRQMDKLDDGSPVNRWLQAEMLFQTGLAQIKFGTRINGAYKMLSAYERIKDNRRKYPDFWQNRKLTGIFNIVLANIPPFLRWAADLFGYAGDSSLGMYQLQEYANQAESLPGLAEEAVIMVNLGYLLAGQEDEAFRYIASRDESLLKPALVKYLYSNSASFVYRNDLTLKYLLAIDAAGMEVRFYALPYALGRCKLNHLEPDAKNYLQSFLDDYPVLDYKKAACNRLSYCYLLEGNMEKYREYKEKVLTIGQSIRDRDQEAVIESSDPLVPHPGLLRARLLCDGGYFNEALGVMNSVNPDELTETAYRLEYFYRMGRIMQLKGQPDNAVPYLKKSYEEGKNLPYTFATRSALFLGKIYEEKKEFALASQWYQRCTEIFSPANTTEGVKTSAEKGMKRIKGRL